MTLTLDYKLSPEAKLVLNQRETKHTTNDYFSLGHCGKHSATAISLRIIRPQTMSVTWSTMPLFQHCPPQSQSAFVTMFG